MSAQHLVSLTNTEHVILKHTMIKVAIVFGDGKVYPGVLIQPNGDCTFDLANDRLTSQYKDAIWSVSSSSFRRRSYSLIQACS